VRDHLAIGKRVTDEGGELAVGSRDENTQDQ
jgi:hypothetical protein